MKRKETRLVISYWVGTDCDEAEQHVLVAPNLDTARLMASARIPQSLHGCVQIRRETWTGIEWEDAGLFEEV